MRLTLVILTLITLISCNKDISPLPIEDEVAVSAIEDCISIGDSVSNNIVFININPDIIQESFNVPTYTDLDINSDGIMDFQFKVNSAYPFAGTWFNGCEVTIKSLNPNAEISKDSLYVDSSYYFPHLYLENDLLKQSSLWSSDEYLISANGDDPTDSCFGPNCTNISIGPWFGQSCTYIGVRINGTSLGWIKISLPSTDVNYGQSLHILEYGIIN